jgi:4-amino-4-deoxy-L-arabinose transferase-like glycosyltransferase
MFHEDAAGYEGVGIYLASQWRGERPPMVMSEWASGFYFIAGAVYYVFGRYPVVLSYFNCIIGTLVTFFVYRLALRFFHPQVGRRAALLVGLMPSMILWSAVALKEPMVNLSIVLALSACVSLRERVTAGGLIAMLSSVLLVQWLRFYMIYFVGFAVIVSLVLERGARVLTGIYKQIFIALSIVGLLVLLGLAESTSQQLSYFNLEFANAYRQGMASTADSGFAADVDVSTPTGALLYLPVGIAHLLFAPFPWQITSFRALLASPETVFWWFLFPATLRGIMFAIKQAFGRTSALLIFAFTLIPAYSLVQGNVGSAFRQRAQILVFLFIFCALGIYVKRVKRAGLDPRLLLAEAASAPEAEAPAESTPVPALGLGMGGPRGHGPV